MIILWEVLIILGLILANGFFAAAEIAIITARRSRLEQQAGSGDPAARIAAELARDPTRLLAITQVGITLVGTLAAVFGGAHLVGYLAGLLARIPLPLLAHRAESIALVLVVLAISFLSLVLGELVPKRLALGNAERLARVVAEPMQWMARVGRPVVWLVGTTTDAVLALLGRRDLPGPSVSIEDIEHLIKTGTNEGLLKPAEQMVARRALRLGDRTVREIMRPRIDIDALDVDTPPEEVIGAAAMAGFSRLPVHEGDMDHVIGFVYMKDLLLQHHLSRPMNLRKMVRPALLVPATMPIDRLLDAFRQRRTQMAIVLDEFGGTAGMVTLEDVLEQLVGEIHDERRLDNDANQPIVARDARSWLVDAGVNVGDFFNRLGWGDPPANCCRDFSSVGGLVISGLGRIPQIGDRTSWHGLDLEVVAMDGPRLDRILVTLRDAGPCGS
jgi:putative hemolysin